MYMYAGMSVDLHEPSAHNNNKLLAPDKRVKVKNSPPKSLSAGSWPTVNQQLTDSWPTVNQQLNNSWPTVNRQLTGSWPTVNQQLTDS